MTTEIQQEHKNLENEFSTKTILWEKELNAQKNSHDEILRNLRQSNDVAQRNLRESNDVAQRNLREINEVAQKTQKENYEKEVEYLIEQEWAKTGEDILWRRTKLGLKFTPFAGQPLQ